MTASPILMTWDGEAFYPADKGWARKCDEHFTVGERYQLVEHRERSRRSHNHYFVTVENAFNNLPEDQEGRFATADHLRYWALIRAGYRDDITYGCATKAEAKRWAANLRPKNPYALIIAHEAVVILPTAKSQTMKAMGAEVFQESKEAVLGILSDLLGVDVTTLNEATTEVRAA